MKLFLCNTYYQIIVAVQLSLTEYKDSEKVILINENINNSAEIIRKIKETGLFKSVFSVSDKYDKWRIWMFSSPLHFFYDSRIEKIFGGSNNLSVLEKCDEFLFANIGGIGPCLAMYLKCRRPDVKLSMFEDGVSSYSNIYSDAVKGGLNNTNSVKRLMYSIIKNTYKYIDFYYVFLPELMVWDCPYSVKKIVPILEQIEKLKPILNYIFDYEALSDKYEEKVIFFEESYIQDGVNVDDFSVVKKLEEIYGKDNIFIKLHPRVQSNRFSEHGYHTNTNFAIPWEVIAINIPLNEKILASISSTAILSSFLLSNGDVKMMFCYNEIEYDKIPRLKFTIEVINKLESLYPDAFISI